MRRPVSNICIALLLSALLLTTQAANAAAVDIDADRISRTVDGVIIAQGHVVIRRAFDTLSADRVTYRSREHLLEAKGHVIISSEQAQIQAEEAIMHTGSRAGRMTRAVITLPGGERLSAARVRRIDDNTYEADELTFSACPIDQESWRIAAVHALLDQRDGSLTATHSRFELWGVPVLYAPWWQQPLKRKSGLLLPNFASGKRRGSEISLPYYLAPAANWDATLTPHWMSARGFMGETELRHVSALGSERIVAAGIHDRVIGSNRSRIQGDIRWRLPAGLYFDAAGDHVSDHNYLADYATGREISAIYLRSRAALSQSLQYDAFSGDWMLQAVHQQNMLLASNATMLQILPQLQSRMQWALGPRATLHLDQQSTRFDRRSGIDGWRVHLHPYIELPWELAGGGLAATLSGGMQHTRYWLQQTAAGLNRTPTRTAGEAALQLRADFERISADRSWRHVISPILRFDYVNAPDQSALPNFDSAFGLLTWSNLLSGNRYSGYDRIENSRRISMLLETRLQAKDNSGAPARDLLTLRGGTSYELLRNSIDQRLRPTPARPLSNLLGEITWQPLSELRLYSSGQYNAAERYWATLISSLDWTPVANSSLHIGYHFTDARYATETRLLDLRLNSRLGSRWQAHVSLQYDVSLKLSQQTTIGLQYNHACWTLGVEGYRINRRSGTSTAANLGFRLLLEFKGLGSVGS